MKKRKATKESREAEILFMQITLLQDRVSHTSDKLKDIFDELEKLKKDIAERLIND